jgi:hypothetical protein
VVGLPEASCNSTLHPDFVELIGKIKFHQNQNLKTRESVYNFESSFLINSIPNSLYQLFLQFILT